MQVQESKEKKIVNIDGFLKRYPKLNPLLILRTIENCKTLGEAFDVLESMKPTGSYIWNNETESWKSFEFKEAHVKKLFNLKKK